MMKKLHARIAAAALFAALAMPAAADPAPGEDTGAKIEFLRDMALRDSWAAAQIVPTLQTLAGDADVGFSPDVTSSPPSLTSGSFSFSMRNLRPLGG